MFKKFCTSRFLILIGIVLLVSALSTVLVVAQDGAETAVSEGNAPSGIDGTAAFSIPVQGRLTDAAGNPLNGDYDMTFRFYAASTGGTALCSDANLNVPVTNGLFYSNIYGTCADDITGQQLYLSIQVESDPEMTDRQPIYPVPYAASLRPQAVISATLSGDAILHIENSGSTGRGLRSYATSTSGTNYGIIGASRSPDGYGGYFYNNTGGVALWSWTNATSPGVPAIFGCVASSSGSCDHGVNPAGVLGTSSEGDGVQGITSNLFHRGVYAQNTGAGVALAAYANSESPTNHWYPTLYLMQADADGDFVVGANAPMGTRYWRVDRTGKGFFNGGTQASGADFAEQIAVKGSEAQYEPGDVLVISTSADRTVELSSGAFSKAVIGVYSTDPALLAGAPDTDNPLAGVPVAVVGIVPCKVSAENGPIQRGDLLVTSSTPGYAMRAGDNPPQGTVLGKAMEILDTGTGIILILVVLQ